MSAITLFWPTVQICQIPLNAPIGKLKKDTKEKLAETVFYFLKADTSRSKCSFKAKKQAVNLYDGDGMQVPCQLNNCHEIRTTGKLLEVKRIL